MSAMAATEAQVVNGGVTIGGGDVVAFKPGFAPTDIQLTLHVETIRQVKNDIEKIEVACEWARGVIARAGTRSNAEILAGVQALMESLAAALAER